MPELGGGGAGASEDGVTVAFDGDSGGGENGGTAVIAEEANGNEGAGGERREDVGYTSFGREVEREVGNVG